jgi:hypothetical protein
VSSATRNRPTSALAASSSTFASRSSTAFQLHSSFFIAVRPCGGTELAAQVLEHEIPHLLSRGRADMKKITKVTDTQVCGPNVGT